MKQHIYYNMQNIKTTPFKIVTKYIKYKQEIKTTKKKKI